MDRQVSGAMIAVVAGALVTGSLHANMLTNPSFEESGNADGPSAGWSWGASRTNLGADAYDGDFVLEITDSVNQWKNFGQYVSITEDMVGKPFVASLWAMTPSSNPVPSGALLKMVFEGAGDPTTTIIPAGSPEDEWLYGEIEGTIPDGTAGTEMKFEVLYANSTDQGTIYYDMASFEVVPEPATLGLVAAGLAGLALRRRRACS